METVFNEIQHSVKNWWASLLLGTFNVLKANVTKSGNDYKFTGNGTVSMGMESNKKDYAFTMTGTINTMKDSFSIIFNTPAVMGGLTITLLPGNAPSATEK